MLRIDDIDTPRNVKGAAQQIADDLEIFGLHWDGDIYFQSDNLHCYRAVIRQLLDERRLYPCTCSRKFLEQATQSGSSVYPGFCRTKTIQPEKPSALRLIADDLIISFTDRLQGPVQQAIARELGDFIVQRKDRIVAYQLAVVIDDYLQNITHVVRGFDLLDSTPRQIFIQRLLGYRQPDYMHVPIIVDRSGLKLSKQTEAPAVDTSRPGTTLFYLLELLRQNPPDTLRKAQITDILTWAIAHWEPENLKKVRAIH